MTREEIIQAIANDKTMPFIQPEQLAGIVDFVIKNYNPSLPSNLDEAANMYGLKSAHGEDNYCAWWHRDGFKAGAEWQKQKESLHISEICKENADSFTDEDESFKKFSESVKALVEAVEGYVCPKKGDKYVSRTEVLVKCNELKKLLGI